MSSTEDYIQIMIDSLKKKTVILDRILSKNETQKKCLEENEFENIDWDGFNTAMVEKEAEIERVNEIDEGFQLLYDRVSNQIKNDKRKFSSEIKVMQSLIKHLEEQSILIRAGEERNRAMIEKVMVGRKKEIKKARTSLKVAANYYQTMTKITATDMTTLDRKK